MDTHTYEAPAAQAALQRALSSAFRAGDLADLMLTISARADIGEACELFASSQRRVVCVVEGGRRIGWIASDQVTEANSISEIMRPFTPESTILDTASIKDVIINLAKHDPLFVQVMGETAAVLTIDDLQEAPMRMWLFGLITLIESLMTRMLIRQFPNDSWCQYLSEGRLAIARNLQQERLRRCEDVELVQCLQLADKGDIVLKYEPAREAIGFESRRKGQEFFSRMENMRNCLAHSNVLPIKDLSLLVTLAENLDRLLNVATNPLLPVVEAP